jgi:hypothetical protein
MKESLLNKLSSRIHHSQPQTINNVDSGEINNGPEIKPGILSDNAAASTSNKSSPEEEPTNQTPGNSIRPSWLHQVKGRITKTVEEKYTEYKNEKEMRR